MLNTAKEIIDEMMLLRNDAQRTVLMGFFKTGPGEYGEGDKFLGIRVPTTRNVVKKIASDFPLDETGQLLLSPWHEVRLCGLLFLVAQYERVAHRDGDEAKKNRDNLVSFYLRHADRVNNWDLVDASAPKILGNWLTSSTALGDPQAIIDQLAHSDNLWQRRMSMVCTLTPIQQGDPSWCLRYAEIHLHDTHDLMQKAVGWMLREMGKHVSMDLLRAFLHQHAHEMPRTMLRYAIERFDTQERKVFMGKE